jgi:phenylalanyl-tRNA synthetase alpha chain
MAEEAVLGFLQTEEQISDSQEFAASIGVGHTELENVIKSLKGFEIVDAKVNINRTFLNSKSDCRFV